MAATVVAAAARNTKLAVSKPKSWRRLRSDIRFSIATSASAGNAAMAAAVSGLVLNTALSGCSSRT